MDAQRGRHVADRQVLLERVKIDIEIDETRCSDRLNLGAEQQAALALRVKQRLDAQAISDEHELRKPFVPERDREHAPEVLDKTESEVFVKMNDDLDVAPRRKAVPALLQLPPQCFVIVDFSVADDGHAAVLGKHGLMSAFDIDDRQPRHPHRDRLRGVQPLIVRTTMQE